jgi:hypothetical protein
MSERERERESGWREVRDTTFNGEKERNFQV